MAFSLKTQPVMQPTFRRVTIAAAVGVFALYAGLIAALFYFFDADQIVTTLQSPRIGSAIRLSVIAATIATAASLLIALPAAYALCRYRFFGRRIIDTMLELPMIVSPAALGAMLLIFLNQPAGQWLQHHTTPIVFTVAGVIVAQFVTTAGISTRLIKAALDEIPARYDEMARCLGASPGQAFWTVSLPLARRGIIAASVLTWAKALGEFGATITVAGTMAHRTETVPIAIYMRLASADIEGTVALILVLVGVGLGLLYIVRLLLGESIRA